METIVQNHTGTQGNSKRLMPWRWAESLSHCWLFWLPVKLNAIPQSQKEWLLEFFSRLTGQLDHASQLRGEYFMQMQTIDSHESIRRVFLNSMLKDTPLIGTSRRPHQNENPGVTPHDVDAFAKKKREFRAEDFIPENACWFLTREDARLRWHYLGYGGLTILYRKQEPQPASGGDPAPALPQLPRIIPKFLRQDPTLKPLLEGFNPDNPGATPAFLRNHPSMKQVFSAFDVEKTQEKTQSLLSPFGRMSKEIFGGGMERDLKSEAQPFLLPRLSSQDFFSHTTQELRGWFELFDVYVAESLHDEGIIMACKDNLTSMVAAIVEEMRHNGYRYWEG